MMPKATWTKAALALVALATCINADEWRDVGECSTVKSTDGTLFNRKLNPDMAVNMNIWQKTAFENFYGFTDESDTTGLMVVHHPKGRLHLLFTRNPGHLTWVLTFRGRDGDNHDHYEYVYLANNDNCWLWYNEFILQSVTAAPLKI